MCCSRDAGMAMVNMSIDMAKEKDDPRYYMDSMKLHKLLYLSQWTMLQKYGSRVFKETIWAHKCGPYVDGIKIIPARRGFAPINQPFDPEEDEIVWPSVARVDVMEQILEEYGWKTTEELIRITKNTTPYLEVKDRITAEHKPEITKESMEKDRPLFQAG